MTSGQIGKDLSLVDLDDNWTGSKRWHRIRTIKTRFSLPRDTAWRRCGYYGEKAAKRAVNIAGKKHLAVSTHFFTREIDTAITGIEWIARVREKKNF